MAGYRTYAQPLVPLGKKLVFAPTLL